MAPIRVGIIGLTTVIPSGEGYTPGSWGLAHLACLANSPHYKIVALCNSTVEKAHKSIEHNKLDPVTKAYGSAEELAQDPDVDLIIVSVHVDKHYALLKPALQNKKSVFVEFPLTGSYKEAEELAELAKQAGVKSVVGAQARANPALKKVKELIKSGAIGDVVTTSWTGHLILSTWSGIPEALKDFVELDGGPGRINIGLGHGLDPFLDTLGDFKDVQAIFKTYQKTTSLFNSTGTVIDPAYKATAPEYILVQGVLESGAVASINVRSTPTSVDEAGFRWIISGSEGEIEFTSPAGGYIQGSGPNCKVLLRKWKGGMEEVDLRRDEPAHVTNVLEFGINTARLYEAFATGDEDGYPSIESARKVHHLIERIKKVAVWAP
ncbi:oxidoreductase, putative [Talaromyces stipitatus ATCC 10500]|uniref:Oxidoreductase, putative n=1 Tax=Talaromyces stipitatus (strain ATCC 10500 / CBS 375.48 / QM 6759 / NRRL 1006) TaxID=441959 RepID=B8MHT7_TALSN|nr:oxidoreductase, putative [Talaromyces stipitatus ATCC 10500]EED16417.1 oxidoreductase, putative [Talaromyces stipitatus ATCC 10500]